MTTKIPNVVFVIVTRVHEGNTEEEKNGFDIFK